MTEEIAELPVVLMRGGTSKALFFHEKDLPEPGRHRDRLLLRAMGSPDLTQIDGMGGGKLVTSKIAIIRRSERSDADVDYTFAQVDTDRAIIGYEGNCGNISSAVAPFAVNEGLVRPNAEEVTVRIYNTNTDKILLSRIRVANGRARVTGDCAIPGVPGTGAEIMMDYAGTIGAGTGRLLPSGKAQDVMTLSDGREVRVTICDVGNAAVLIRAEDIGMSGGELPPGISADPHLVATISEIQARAGEVCGFWDDWTKIDRPGLPQALLVLPPVDFIGSDGRATPAASMNVWGRMFFLGKCHDSMSGTGSMCFAAASAIAGSVVQEAMSTAPAIADRLLIGHPLGLMSVEVRTSAGKPVDRPEYDRLGFARTARPLMKGIIYIPTDALPEPDTIGR